MTAGHGTTSDPPAEGAEAILAVLRRADGRALSATELFARLRNVGLDTARAARGLADLEAAGRVVVLDHAPPDVHLRGMDLRGVCAVDEPSPEARDRAHRAVEEHWQRFLRDFLAAHRCG